MEVKYNREEDAYVCQEKVDNQTIELGMNFYWSNIDDTKQWYNVYITIFNKRKDMYNNMDKKIITGKNPFQTFAKAREMFYAVEAELLKQELYYGRANEIVIFCTWVDNRRRDAYYKVLHKMGYNWGITPQNEKCIMKTFTINDINPVLWDED